MLFESVKMIPRYLGKCAIWHTCDLEDPCVADCLRHTATQSRALLEEVFKGTALELKSVAGGLTIWKVLLPWESSVFSETPPVLLRTDWSAFPIYPSFFCPAFKGLSRFAAHLAAERVRNTGVGWGSDSTLAKKKKNVAVSLSHRDVAEVRLKIWLKSKEREVTRGKYGRSRVAWLCQILNNALVRPCGSKRDGIIKPRVYSSLA